MWFALESLQRFHILNDKNAADYILYTVQCEVPRRRQANATKMTRSGGAKNSGGGLKGPECETHMRVLLGGGRILAKALIGF